MARRGRPGPRQPWGPRLSRRVTRVSSSVLVNVPWAERYALHKLIVSRRRREGAAKIDKNLAQAETLLDTLAERRKADLRDAWEEMRERGPKWRKLADEALESIDAGVRERFLAVVSPPTG